MTSNRKSNLSEAIYQNMKLKETDELLEIWSDNDRLEWSDEAFEIIHDILLERLGNVPPQATLKSARKHRKSMHEKVKLPLPFTLMIAAFLLIIFLLNPLIDPKPDGQWFSVLMLSLLAIFFFAPGFYFGWLGWINGKETKQKIIKNLPKTKEELGFFYRIYSLFLPDQYVPAYFLLSIRIMSVVLIYGGVRIVLLMV